MSEDICPRGADGLESESFGLAEQMDYFPPPPSEHVATFAMIPPEQLARLRAIEAAARKTRDAWDRQNHREFYEAIVALGDALVEAAET